MRTPQLNERVDALVAELTGSCSDLNKALFPGEDYYTMSILVDEHIRLCESCGWWFELEELDAENVCNDCGEAE